MENLENSTKNHPQNDAKINIKFMKKTSLEKMQILKPSEEKTKKADTKTSKKQEPKKTETKPEKDKKK